MNRFSLIKQLKLLNLRILGHNWLKIKYTSIKEGIIYTGN